MANTYIVSGSQFKPYTFDEMIKPALMYKQAYDTLENSLSDLEVKSGDIPYKLTNSEEDKKLLEKYNNYNNKLMGVAEEMLQGKNLTDIKKEINTLKKEFQSNFAPIDEAYKNRVEFEKTLQKAKLNNPNLLIAASNYSTSDFMRGNTPDAPRILNKIDILNSSIKGAEASSNRIVNYGNWYPDAGGALISRQETTGWSEADLYKAYSDYSNKDFTNPNAIIFGKIVNDELTKYGDISMFSSSDQSTILNSIYEGIFKGVKYKNDIKSYSNPFKNKDTDDSSSDINYTNISTIPIRVRNRISQNERDAIALKFQKYIKDGTFTLNPETGEISGGIKNLIVYKGGRNPEPNLDTKIELFFKDVWNRGLNADFDAAVRNYRNIDPKFSEQMQFLLDNDLLEIRDKRKGREDKVYKNLNPEDYNSSTMYVVVNYDKLNALYNNTINGQYDARIDTEFTMPISKSSTQSSVLSNLNLSGVSQLKEQKYDSKSKKYVDTSTTINISDIKPESISGFVVSSAGLLLNIGGKDYNIPENANPVAIANIKSYSTKLEENAALVNRLQNEINKEIEKNTKGLTEKEKESYIIEYYKNNPTKIEAATQASKNYESLLQLLYNDLAQLGITYSTKDIEIEF